YKTNEDGSAAVLTDTCFCLLLLFLGFGLVDLFNLLPVSAHFAVQRADAEEDQIERDADGDQDGHGVQDEVDKEIHKTLPEIDQVLDGVARDTLRLPTADLDRLDGRFGNDADADGG